MSEFFIRIEAINQENEEEVRLADIMEKIVNKRAEKYEGVAEAIQSAQSYFIKTFGENYATLDMHYWNEIMKEVVRMEMKNELERLEK